MRSLSSVTFTGLFSSTSAEFTKIMISDDEVVDLRGIYHAIYGYSRKGLCDGDCEENCRAHRYLRRATYEVDMQDEPAFRWSRSKVLAIVA